MKKSRARASQLIITSRTLEKVVLTSGNFHRMKLYGLLALASVSAASSPAYVVQKGSMRRCVVGACAHSRHIAAEWSHVGGCARSHSTTASSAGFFLARRAEEAVDRAAPHGPAWVPGSRGRLAPAQRAPAKAQRPIRAWGVLCLRPACLPRGYMCRTPTVPRSAHTLSCPCYASPRPAARLCLAAIG